MAIFGRLAFSLNQDTFGPMNRPEPTDPYLFLDCDGVLNSRESNAAYGSPGYPGAPWYFDEVAVRLVAKLCFEEDLSVVVSSSWRGGGPEQFAAWMANYGWLRCPVVGETIYRGLVEGDPSRGALISHWLENDAPERDPEYVIVDDTTTAGDGHPEEKLVQTSFKEGFGWSDYRAAKRALHDLF